MLLLMQLQIVILITLLETLILPYSTLTGIVVYVVVAVTDIVDIVIIDVASKHPDTIPHFKHHKFQTFQIIKYIFSYYIHLLFCVYIYISATP